MKRLMQNSVDIDAPAAAVWAVLGDFALRGNWDPYYRDIRGELAPGARLTVRASLEDGDRLVTSHPRIVDLVPGRLLVWRNQFFVPGLLDSHNGFSLVATANQTTLHQREVFSGVLVGASRSTLDKVDARLSEWVLATKRRVEAPTVER